jgi:hypothetical protein
MKTGMNRLAWALFILRFFRKEAGILDFGF